VGAGGLLGRPLFPAAVHGHHRRLGSIMGSFFGAAFIVILPIFLNQFLPALGAVFGVRFPRPRIAFRILIIFGR
jgi:hypothetical protein